MTTGRNLAAKPRSDNHTSPGRGFIEEVQDFLLDRTGPDDLEEALVSQLNDLVDLTPDLFSDLGAPFA
jgi:hypothetical protein